MYVHMSLRQTGIFIVSIFCAGLVLGGLFRAGIRTIDGGNPTVSIPQSNTIFPPIKRPAAGIPTGLAIPAIGLSTYVESVGLAADGSMAVPKQVDNVGWYALGVKPGENGNAVIDGHFDRADGSPAPFYFIPKLSAGSEILVTDSHRNAWHFRIRSVVNYPYDAVPLTEIFGAGHTPALNLITCSGIWNDTTKNYSERTVVYSDLETGS